MRATADKVGGVGFIRTARSVVAIGGASVKTSGESPAELIEARYRAAKSWHERCVELQGEVAAMVALAADFVSKIDPAGTFAESVDFDKALALAITKRDIIRTQIDQSLTHLP